jgi:M6 family metalloprotease-like protein
MPRHILLWIAAALVISPTAARATALTPAGIIPPEVSQAFDDGLFRLPVRPEAGVSASQDVWRVPVLMITFTDDSLTYTPQNFNFALFDTTHATPLGSVYDYYKWVSGNRLTVLGNVVAVVNLPHDHFYYGYGSYGLNTPATPQNMYGAIRDALVQCQAQVTWSNYDLDHDGYVDMLWVIHAGNGGEAGLDRNSFWSMTSRLSGGWRYGTPFVTPELVPGSTTQYMRLDRFSMLPELSSNYPTARSEIGVYCHEFGHALGLPDLYDTSQLGGGANQGPGNWSLMSSGAYGLNGVTADRPSHLGAWPMLYLGWCSTIQPMNDTTMTLSPIESGGPIASMWFQGETSSERFLIENRERLGFDAFLPSPGLLVYHVDESGIGSRLAANRINAGLTPGLQVVEADGHYDLTYGHNRGDSSDPYPGSLGVLTLNDDTQPSTRSFAGAPTVTSLSNFTPLGNDMRFTMKVRAPGWATIQDQTAAPYSPVSTYGPAVTAVVDTLGTLSSVACELRSGIPQVILRERRHGMWQPPLTLTQSSVGAYEPTVGQLANGDLAVAWRDQRNGASRIYYRVRIRGSWGPEQPVGNIASNASQPAMAINSQGMVNLAWLDVSSGLPRVMFMRFAYISPFGNAVAVSDSGAYPDAPAVAADPSGRAYVLWPDRAISPRLIRFVRYRPDSGISAPLQLGPSSGVPQVAVSAAVDGQGVLHALWQELGSGGTALHYQRRDFSSNYWMRDTTIEVQPGGAQNSVLALDPQGGVHVAFESAIAGVQEIRYRRYAPGRGWEVASTEITRPSDGNAHVPKLAPMSPGNVTLLYTGYPAGTPRFMVRDRWLDGTPQLTAAPAAVLEAAGGLMLAPNPLHAGTAFELRWSGASAGRSEIADIYDLSGRRVASLPLAGQGSVRTASAGASWTATWPAGLYFARVRGGSASIRMVVLR